MNPTGSVLGIEVWDVSWRPVEGPIINSVKGLFNTHLFYSPTYGAMIGLVKGGEPYKDHATKYICDITHFALINGPKK